MLYQSFYEWTLNQIPKAEKVGARSLHHLEETQVLISNFVDHNPHVASSEKHYRDSISNGINVEMDIGAEARCTQIQN